MAYTDATLVDGAQYKRRVQAFVSADLLPYESALTGGVILGYLPKNIFILGSYITTLDGADTWPSPPELFIRGISSANLLNKTAFWHTEQVVEVKRAPGGSGLSVPYVYIIIYIDIDADDGLVTDIIQPAIASDGSIAVRR